LYFGYRQTDKQTDKKMDSINGLSRSRCRERRLNNPLCRLQYYKSIRV